MKPPDLIQGTPKTAAAAIVVGGYKKPPGPAAKWQTLSGSAWERGTEGVQWRSGSHPDHSPSHPSCDPGFVSPARMPSVLWSSLPVVLGLLLWHPAGASSPCWESSKCQDLTSEAGILACAAACRADLSAEAPVYPGNGHLQPLSESIRKYVMSHFRWNKFGRRNSSSGGGHKREEMEGGNPPPASLPAIPLSHHEEEQGTGLEREEGKRSYSMEHFRWGKPVGRKRRPIKVYPNGVEEESAESYPLEFRRELALGSTGAPPEEEEEEEEEGQEEEKKAGSSYRMRHFRWHAPLKDKRYGGFMTSEHSQTPLVTLFKNAIIKSAYKKGQ
ncbi:pro-opiomelanocortin [Ciconia maguari]